MKKILMVVILTTSLLYPADAQQILSNIRDKYSSLKDFSADIKQEGNNPVFNGKIFYKKENNFRVELKNVTVISDGETVWNYNKKENKVIISNAEPQQNIPFSFETLLYTYPSKSNISASKEGTFNVLTFTPKQGEGLNYKIVKLWINDNNLIERIMIESQGQKMELRISDYKINQNLSESKFKLDAPEGSKIIDLR